MLRSRKYSFQPSSTTATDNQKVALKCITPSGTPTANVEWVGPITLRRRAKPELENERHRDISLYLSVQEVKNLNNRGRYFCEICLDRTLYARTTSKSLDSTVFWGENFDLNNLPEISILTINLYKQRDVLKEKRYRSKGQNQFIAFVTIPLVDWTPDTMCTQWFPMQSPQAVTKTSVVPTRTCSAGATSLASSPSSTVEGSGKSRELVNSPVSIRFRKRSTPVSCFRSPESPSSSLDPTGELSSEPVPAGYTGKKSRTSWVASLSMDSSYRQQNGVTSESNQTSPRSSSSSMSAFSFHNPAMPQIRLQIRYEITEVLPLSSYDDLRQYIASNYRSLVRCLEPNLSAKQKEALASCLVYTFEKLPDLSVFQLLVDMLEDELLKNNDPALIFRSNSIGSKAMECYMKLVGSDYLHRMLKPCIDQLLTSDDDFELDPSRLGTSHESTSGNPSNNGHLARNLAALLKSLDMLWQQIRASEEYLPRELKVTFNSLGRITERHCGQEAAGRLTSSFLFLRLICPAIHGPVLYGLTTCVPESSRISRNLTLVAKVLQNLANLTLFGEKEQHMKAVNVFVESQLDSMHSFLHRITAFTELCDETLPSDTPEHHRFIDAGYELARLSRLLAAHQSQLNDELAELTILLQSVNEQTHAVNWPFTKGNFATDTTLKSSVAPIQSEIEGKGEGNIRKKYSHSSCADASEHRKPDLETAKCLPNGQGQTGEVNPGGRTVRAAASVSGLQVTTASDGLPAKSASSPIHLGGRKRISLVVDQPFSGPDQLVERVQIAESNGCSPGANSPGCQTSEAVQTTPVGQRKDVDCTRASRSETSDLRENRSFGNVFEYSDYTDDGYSCAEGRKCDGSTEQPTQQGLKGATSENVLSYYPRCSLGESPSLDQLAEKMQEMKLILQTKRREAQRMAAGRVQAYYSREESLERMIDQVNQLRRVTQTPEGHSETLEQTLSGPTVVHLTPSTGGVSPSASSFSSSGYSEVGPLTDDRRGLADRRHQMSREVTMPESEYSGTVANAIGQHCRCQSFRSRAPPVSRTVPGTANIREPMGKHSGLNLLDLSLASEGTGIPLGRLIMSNNAPSANLSGCYHRRCSESKFVEN